MEAKETASELFDMQMIWTIVYFMHYASADRCVLCQVDAITHSSASHRSILSHFSRLDLFRVAYFTATLPY